MKKNIIVFVIVVMGIGVLAQGAEAVYDATVHTQLVLNIRAELEALERNRKWLDTILEQSKIHTKINAQTQEEIKSLKTTVEEIKKKVGDPKLLDTGVSNVQGAKITSNLTYTVIRSRANGKNLTDYDSKKLYGDDADPEYKYHVSESAYINFEKVIEENRVAKQALIAKRSALALALKSVRSLAEVKKLSVALQVVNGKLDTIREQEQQAFMKLLAHQVRNEQKEKLKNDAAAEKFLKNFFNTKLPEDDK
jgi:type II secretory pathway pseudopilin PulG